MRQACTIGVPQITTLDLTATQQLSMTAVRHLTDALQVIWAHLEPAASCLQVFQVGPTDAGADINWRLPVLYSLPKSAA